MKTIKFKTKDGDGEATKEGQDKPWEVSMPIGDFRWFGSVPEIKREIERRNNHEKIEFSD